VGVCAVVRVQVNTDGEDALPPLHSAALEANLEMVDVLLAAGANPRQMYPVNPIL
jgi:ankyrin repeat protein